MKYEALKHQGSKGDKHTADAVGEKAGDSGRTVQGVDPVCQPD